MILSLYHKGSNKKNTTVVCSIERLAYKFAI